MFPYLAAAFFLLLIVAIFYGMGIVLRPQKSDRELQVEKCSLCRREFERSDLIEREVGDMRVYYFCEDCIRSLNEDLKHSGPAARPSKTAS